MQKRVLKLTKNDLEQFAIKNPPKRISFFHLKTKPEDFHYADVIVLVDEGKIDVIKNRYGEDVKKAIDANS